MGGKERKREGRNLEKAENVSGYYGKGEWFENLPAEVDERSGIVIDLSNEKY